jgi:hypothetical protein
MIINQFPVIVFTQYDRLVRMKEVDLLEDDESIDMATLKDQSREEARKAFKICVHYLRRRMDHLKILMSRSSYVVKVTGIFVSLYHLAWS